LKFRWVLEKKVASILYLFSADAHFIAEFTILLRGKAVLVMTREFNIGSLTVGVGRVRGAG